MHCPLFYLVIVSVAMHYLITCSDCSHVAYNYVAVPALHFNSPDDDTAVNQNYNCDVATEKCIQKM